MKLNVLRRDNSTAMHAIMLRPLRLGALPAPAAHSAEGCSGRADGRAQARLFLAAVTPLAESHE